MLKIILSKNQNLYIKQNQESNQEIPISLSSEPDNITQILEEIKNILLQINKKLNGKDLLQSSTFIPSIDIFDASKSESISSSHIKKNITNTSKKLGNISN